MTGHLSVIWPLFLAHAQKNDKISTSDAKFVYHHRSQRRHFSERDCKFGNFTTLLVNFSRKWQFMTLPISCKRGIFRRSEYIFGCFFIIQMQIPLYFRSIWPNNLTKSVTSYAPQCDDFRQVWSCYLLRSSISELWSFCSQCVTSPSDLDLWPFDLRSSLYRVSSDQVIHQFCTSYH